MPTKATTAFLPGLITAIVLFGGYGVVKLVQKARAPSVPTPSPASAEASSFARATGDESAGLRPSSAALQLPQVRADTDSDGLPDDLERIYQTDAQNPDTDGDGYQDGLEVANGYDPTKKAPGDKITIPAPSPSPSAEATGDLRPATYTEQFLSQTKLPADPKSVLNSEELGSFVAAANVRGFLPEVPDRELNIVSGLGKALVERYLDAVSVPQNRNITPVSAEQLSEAFKTLTGTGNPAPLNDLIAKLSRNVEELKKAPVPAEAVALHRQFVAASISLRDNAQALLNYRTDYVGALVASSRVENLRSVFRAVGEEIQRLEKKYGIT